jgi:hypothetical protein
MTIKTTDKESKINRENVLQLGQSLQNFFGEISDTFDKLDHFTIVHYFPRCTDMVDLIKRVSKFTAKVLYKVEHSFKFLICGQLTAKLAKGCSLA